MGVESKLCRLGFDQETGHFSVWDRGSDRKAIDCGMFGVWWRENGEDRHTFISQLEQVEIEETKETLRVIGRHSAGWNITWEAKLVAGITGIEVKMSFENKSLKPIELVDMILLEGEYIRPEGIADKWWVFENGWQSWSPSVNRTGIRSSRLPRFFYLRDINLGSLRYRNTWLKRGILSEMVGSLTALGGKESLVLGALTTNQGFVEVFTDKHKFRVTCQAEITVNSGENWESDWVVAMLESRAVALVKYASLVSQKMKLGKTKEVMTGWCSWYWYGPMINERILLDELEGMKKFNRTIPLKVFLIDGGWCKWGEWLKPDPKKFPHRLEGVFGKVRDAGFVSGLWLAPFMVQKDSEIYKNHKDWLIKDRNDKPVEVRKLTTSSLLNEIDAWAMYGLDPTHPQACEYLRQVIRTVVKDLGVKYLKLDFLYGACMGEKYSKNVSRLQALRLGLKLIRETAGEDVYILGCGCPIEAGVGIVDAMRIGLDTGSPLTRTIPLIGSLINDFCYRRARQNAEARSFMHAKWWNNDPDCILVAKGQRLHATEKEAMTSMVRRIGGQIFLSDSLKEVTDEDIEKYIRPMFERVK